MHISEGILAPPVLVGGGMLAVTCLAIGLRGIDHARLMTVALLAAAFFVGSLIHVPVGPASAHLVLNGLLGAILGWAAFPAIFTALLLQVLLFQYGGLSTLGINTLTMGGPAVLCFYLFVPLMRRSGGLQYVGGFCCGALGVMLAAVLTAAALSVSDAGFAGTATAIILGHLPVMLVEGIVTACTVSFLARVRPEVFHNFLQSGKATPCR